MNKQLGPISEDSALMDYLKERKLWGDILIESKVNPVLQNMLEAVIIYYELGRKDAKSAGK
jgi:hypothetical protein